MHSFDGDTSLGDVVRAAMFLKSFPDIKSPEQMSFEKAMANVINEYDKTDLDDLSLAEFLTESESKEDNDNVYEILEEMDFLGDVFNKKRKREDAEPKKKKSKTDETSTSSDTRQENEREMTEKEGASGQKNGEHQRSIR